MDMQNVKDETFGERLRRMRKLQGLTLMQLGERSGIWFTAISKWERDERIPRVQYLKKVADALGVPLDYLTEPLKDEPANGNQPEEDSKEGGNE